MKAAAPSAAPLEESAGSVERFTSVHHPGGAPAALVYARTLALPLSACTLPVMVAATAAALQGQPLLPFLVLGFPCALLAASLYARFSLRRTPAAIYIREDRAAVRSVADCLDVPPPLAWKPVYDLRLTSTAIQTAIGRSTYELPHAEWPEHDRLLAALRRVRQWGF